MGMGVCGLGRGEERDIMSGSKLHRMFDILHTTHLRSYPHTMYSCISECCCYSKSATNIYCNGANVADLHYKMFHLR